MSVHALSLTATPFISSALASQTRRINLARSLKQEVALVSHFFDCKEFHTRAAADLHRSDFTSRSFVVASSPARAMEKGRSFLSMLGFGARGSSAAQTDPATAGIPHGPDDDAPAPGQQFAAFGAGCFWGVELAYQRVPGVTKTEVGYSQGYTHKPSYNDVCSGTTGMNVFASQDISLSLSLSLSVSFHFLIIRVLQISVSLCIFISSSLGFCKSLCLSVSFHFLIIRVL
jgi:hypothetical protein